MTRLGFACHWDPDERRTWSGTPWRLREALRRQPDATVADVGVHLPTLARQGLRVLSARRHDGSWASLWRQSRAGQALVEQSLRRSVSTASPDVVLQIQDLAVLDVPYMVLQDLSYDLLLENYGPDGVPHFRTLGRRRIDLLRARQEKVYASAAALLPMSQWLADSLVAHGVDAARVHVVQPGVNVAISDAPLPERRRGVERRLLFVGRDFDHKSGGDVVAAFVRLRSELGPHLSLTMAGPSVWPLAGEPPPGVRFLGQVPPGAVQRLYDEHDLFVMPSVFEGFGIVFAEALARGLPCIGRRACAMPEIIPEGVGGYLVDDSTPAELGDAIAQALDDDQLYERCAAHAPWARQHFSWQRAAQEVLAVAAG